MRTLTPAPRRCLILALLVAAMALTVQSQSHAEAVTQVQRKQQAQHERGHHQQQQQQQQLQQQPYHAQRKHHQRRQLAVRTQPPHHPDDQVEFVQPAVSAGSQTRNASTTRLRRISARDYYNHNSHSSSGTGNNNNNNNNVAHRRHSKPSAHDWGYNTYNVQTNTYGGGYSPSSGKGDDNTQDVEFISTTNNGGAQPFPAEWPSVVHKKPRRAYDYVPPPPLVPTTAAPGAARRNGFVTYAPDSVITTSSTTTSPTIGTNTTPPPPPTTTNGPGRHVTEDPFGSEPTNTIGKNVPPTDAHDMERRHMCVQQRTITMPVKTTEVYTRPIWKHIKTPCQMQTHANQMCTRVQLVHEQAYRDVIRHKSAQQVTTGCCTGWSKETPHADACMKPVCASRCLNGGTCSSPDTCTCPPGFAGRYCEHDINECKEEKPCDQTCINTLGSYYCKCRDGFMLQPDQQSCKKIDLHEDDAFEARDLENEIESGDDSDMSDRLQKIERSLANERVQTHELQKTLQATYSVVDTLKSRLTTLEKQQQDLHRLQTSLYATESRTNKLEGMVNLLMKCRNAPNAYCP